MHEKPLHPKIFKHHWNITVKFDAFKNLENMASKLPAERQNGTQSAQRRDPGTANGDQNPPLKPLDLAPGPAKMAPE